MQNNTTYIIISLQREAVYLEKENVFSWLYFGLDPAPTPQTNFYKRMIINNVTLRKINFLPDFENFPPSL